MVFRKEDRLSKTDYRLSELEMLVTTLSMTYFSSVGGEDEVVIDIIYDSSLNLIVYLVGHRHTIPSPALDIHSLGCPTYAIIILLVSARARPLSKISTAPASHSGTRSPISRFRRSRTLFCYLPFPALSPHPDGMRTLLGSFRPSSRAA